MSDEDPVIEGTPTHSALDADDAFWRKILGDRGLDEQTIDREAAQGPLQLFVIEQFLLGESPQYDIDEAARLSGIDVEVLRGLWRALGFPDPMPGEPTFVKADLDMFTATMGFIERGDVDMDVALQMARVIGSSMARVAAAQAEIAEAQQDAAAQEGEEAVELYAFEQAVETLPTLAEVIQAVWRRHLAVATRRRILREDDARERPVTVGFADLEGFTSLSQQLPDRELSEVVQRFESLAYDTVARVGGRVVKMIGDEVMFMAEDPAIGAELALSLAETYADDDALSDVRVGLATGPGLNFEGDVYGPAVNLASRIVGLAYPGTVLVPKEVVDALEDHPEYRFRPLRPHYLRHIGRVRLWILRRAVDIEEEAEGEGATLRRARDRRAARRAWIADTMAEQLADRAAAAAGDMTERAIRLVVEGRAQLPGEEELVAEEGEGESGEEDGAGERASEGAEPEPGAELDPEADSESPSA